MVEFEQRADLMMEQKRYRIIHKLVSKFLVSIQSQRKWSLGSCQSPIIPVFVKSQHCSEANIDS